MKRRQFIHLAAMGTAVAALPGASWLYEGHAMWGVAAQPSLPALLGSHEAVMGIGTAFRERYPSESSARLLHERIMRDAGLSIEMPESQARECLERRIRADFAQARTIRLDGWILSRTEARQAALYSLLN